MLRSRNSGENGLMRMPINGGSEPSLNPLRHFLGGKLRVLVFFRVGTISVAILEIDPEILDRLALQFFEHAAVDRLRQPGGAIFAPQFFRRFRELPLGRGRLLAGFWQRLGSRQSDRAREGERIRRDIPPSVARARSPSRLRNARAKQMRAAVHRREPAGGVPFRRDSAARTRRKALPRFRNAD